MDEIKWMRINGNKEPKDEMRDGSLEEKEKKKKKKVIRGTKDEEK